MTSHEIASTDALLTANADLRAALEVAMGECDRRRELCEQLEADYAMLRGVVRLAFNQNGSEQSMRDLWNIATNVDHPGAALNIRFNRAKAVVEAARAIVDTNPAYNDLARLSFALKAALTAYDAALKGGEG